MGLASVLALAVGPGVRVGLSFLSSISPSPTIFYTKFYFYLFDLSVSRV